MTLVQRAEPLGGLARLRQRLNAHAAGADPNFSFVVRFPDRVSRRGGLICHLVRSGCAKEA
ncbi:MAG TPA: hypothetical protein VNN80_05435 [Polyangiaceae bacterium]|nr:hypothetical protein [Polyangiaceae bacterium]